MITLPDLTYTSDISLFQILMSTTKVEMLKVCDKLDFYVSPNVSKEKTASRLEDELLNGSIDILCTLNKQELEIVDEFVKGGANTYVVKKMRKMPYKLQKYYLVLTYCDYENEKWHLLMPDKVRESLAETLPFFLDLARKGLKPPTARQIRIASALRNVFGE